MNKYVIEYPKGDDVKKPLLAQAILETNVLVNILAADVQSSTGKLVVSVLGDREGIKRLIKYLRDNDVNVEELKGNLEKDDEKCVDCGACYGVCPTKAITFQDHEMVLDNDECIRCGACVKACPTRALKLLEG